MTTRHGSSYQLRNPIAPPTVQAVLHALSAHTGSILVFLPGQREILQVARGLADTLGARRASNQVLIAPALRRPVACERQQQAIEPAPPGQRKVVLTTNIAETSLTIEGVEVVVDSGLVREGVFDSATSMTRLDHPAYFKGLRPPARGAGRSARPRPLLPPVERGTGPRLVAHATPELLQADLAPLALQLLAWGVDQPADLAWLDPPPEPAFQQGLGVLETCGAVYRNREGRYQLTPQGVRMAQMPLHPRLAHMLLVGGDINAQEIGLPARRDPVRAQSAGGDRTRISP